MSVAFDDGLRRHVDAVTGAPTYTYIYMSMNANALTTDASWLCKRFKSDGTFSFANGISDFSVSGALITVAQGLTATYAG